MIILNQKKNKLSHKEKEKKVFAPTYGMYNLQHFILMRQSKEKNLSIQIYVLKHFPTFR